MVFDPIDLEHWGSQDSEILSRWGMVAEPETFRALRNSRNINCVTNNYMFFN